MSPTFRKRILDYYPTASSLRLVVVDELHVVSEWGHGFRHPYQMLSVLRARVYKDIPWFGASATLREETLAEVCSLSGFDEYDLYTQSLDRPEIYIDQRIFQFPMSGHRDLFTLLPVLKQGDDPILIARSLPKIIVFCRTMLDIVHAYTSLQQELRVRKFPASVVNSLVDTYFSVRSDFSKEEVSSQFTSNNSDLRIVLATDAVGMGMDWDVDVVVQNGSTSLSLDTLVQRMGRAGRRKDKRAHFLWFSQPRHLLQNIRPATSTTLQQSQEPLPGTAVYQLASEPQNFITDTSQGKSTEETIQLRKRKRKGAEDALQSVQKRARILLAIRHEEEIRSVISSPGCRREALLHLFEVSNFTYSALAVRCCSTCHPDLIDRFPVLKPISQQERRLHSEMLPPCPWADNPTPPGPVSGVPSYISYHMLHLLYRWAEAKSRMVLAGSTLSVEAYPSLVLPLADMKLLAKAGHRLRTPFHVQCVLPYWSWRRDAADDIVRLSMETLAAAGNPRQMKQNEAVLKADLISWGVLSLPKPSKHNGHGGPGPSTTRLRKRKADTVLDFPDPSSPPSMSTTSLSRSMGAQPTPVKRGRGRPPKQPRGAQPQLLQSSLRHSLSQGLEPSSQGTRQVSSPQALSQSETITLDSQPPPVYSIPGNISPPSQTKSVHPVHSLLTPPSSAVHMRPLRPALTVLDSNRVPTSSFIQWQHLK